MTADSSDAARPEVQIPRLLAAYYTEHPDPADGAQLVSFGTSGHRGTSLKGTFNEDHILAICQAIAEYRKGAAIKGPLFIGMDTHGLSEAALRTAVEVLAANGAELRLQQGLGCTPTPVISHAVLCWNRDHRDLLADGVVITPSHNPPEDGGFKYNPPSGGPAGPEVTGWIQKRANELLQKGLAGVKRLSFQRALKAPTVQFMDYVRPYVEQLGTVLDLEAVKRAGIRIGVDPLGGASLAYWGPIAETWGLDIQVANSKVDPAFSFMPLDWDGKVRMDCSSPWAMKNLVDLKDRYDIAFGNDPDGDRHGIVTPQGLMDPNGYLAAAVEYLFSHRPHWSPGAAVGKTLVSSSMIDRAAELVGRQVYQVPVGFKWFVPGLLEGSLGFGGEESAGASFLRRDGSVWTTDKDGIIMGLLAAEILAVTGQNPAERLQALKDRFGPSWYGRIDAPATAEQRERLKKLPPQAVAAQTLAGSPITARLTAAPGNGEPIGGLKVLSPQGWFAARPSGTEEIFKIYAESFVSAGHLREIQEEARQIVAQALG